MKAASAYNQSVWDAQIHPKMYDLYMRNFRKHVDTNVDCKLFMAFSYVSERESRWGSWGHLESLQQVGATDYMDIAPKYQALLDVAVRVVSGVSEKTSVPADFHLEQNYPNPFNPGTMISFKLSKPSQVKLAVYNIIGQEIVTLLDARKSAGSYNVTWNGADKSGRQMPTGVYFYRIEAGDFVEARKMLLVK